MNQLALELARFKLLERACGFVEDGLTDTISPRPALRLEAVKGLVARRALESAGGDFNYVAARKTEPANAEAYRAAAEQCFLMYVEKWQDPRAQVRNSKLRAPSLGFLREHEDEERLIAQRFGAPEVAAESEDPVVQAWNCARSNMDRNLQRVGVLYFVGALFNKHEREAVETELGEASVVLWSKMQTYKTSFLTFSALLQGTYLKEARQFIVDDVLCHGKTIMQYLEPDEAIRSHSEEAEGKFREAIAQHGPQRT